MKHEGRVRGRNALSGRGWYSSAVTEPISLGPAQLEELPQLAAFSRDLVEQGFKWTYTATALSRARRRGDHELVVARNETGPIGFALMHLRSDSAHLILLAVDFPYRRLGIASALMDWLELMAQTAGVFDVDLEVRAKNGGAIEFYRQRGYRAVNRLQGYYGGVEDALRMRADLRVRA